MQELPKNITVLPNGLKCGGFEAIIVADSITKQGKRITTMQLRYPRFIHSELMTHRVLSRNASSSRAIPVQKMIDQVRNEPATPVYWGKNQSGMQAAEELQGKELELAKWDWELAATAAAQVAESMQKKGIHKQVANRILEPFQFISVVVTATEWDNFFELRAHPDAQPEFQFLALMMKAAMGESTPHVLREDEWHVPYVQTKFSVKDGLTYHWNGVRIGLDEALKCSAAACARASYNKHDGTTASVVENIDLHDKLVGSDPKHASPVEHQATPDTISWFASLRKFIGLSQFHNRHLHGNFVGWVQYRKLIE